MEVLISFFGLVIELFKIPITVYGFTFSFWDIFIFCLFSSIICYLIGGFFSG